MMRRELIERYRTVSADAELFVTTNEGCMPGGLMIVGMNPSGQGSGECDFRDCGLSGSRADIRFWKPKRELAGEYLERCAYVDLFPFRAGRQRPALEDEEIDFRGRLLSHTLEYIESVRPRLIVYANTAMYYWGLDARAPWMGYRLERTETPLEGGKAAWPLYEITGINGNELNGGRRTTALEGSFLLQYRQHLDARGNEVPAGKRLAFDDIRCVARFIDEEWEKSL